MGTTFFREQYSNTSYNWRSCLPCTALPFSHAAAYPRGVRHSMYCAQSSKWGLFGRNTRSAIQGTSSRSSLGRQSVFGRWKKARYKRGKRVGNLNKSTFLPIHHTLGGRAYPVRHYPVAIRLRTRKEYAILCIALTPQSGDFSGAILGVRSVALLHGELPPCT